MACASVLITLQFGLWPPLPHHPDRFQPAENPAAERARAVDHQRKTLADFTRVLDELGIEYRRPKPDEERS
jgi:hypothetical protein